MPSSHLILCHPLLLLPSIFPSTRVFSNGSALCARWPKYWSISISPSNEYSGLISFQIDWFDLPAVQGTLKSLIQHHTSLLYGPTLTSLQDYWKDYSFDYMDFCWQSDISAFQYAILVVIAFLPRSKHLLISWLQSLAPVILEPKKIKPVTVSTFLPFICHEVVRSDARLFVS